MDAKYIYVKCFKAKHSDKKKVKMTRAVSFTVSVFSELLNTRAIVIIAYDILFYAYFHPLWSRDPKTYHARGPQMSSAWKFPEIYIFLEQKEPKTAKIVAFVLFPLFPKWRTELRS